MGPQRMFTQVEKQAFSLISCRYCGKGGTEFFTLGCAPAIVVGMSIQAKSRRGVPCGMPRRRTAIFICLINQLVSAAASFAPLDAQAGADVHRQAYVTDRRDVLVIQQVLSLAIDAHPRQQLVARAKVQLGVTVIQIAVGQEQTVAAAGISELQIG